ncbi:carboxylase:pyruvate/acetyl-CoA/propionyl-CoA [Blastomyces dermatitidis ER-3]|uniref:Carboxylase:pyruvate/acetyl-CoA/propionyl-CoA n=1 Tax=Ajellomyces dermatitidis (strain ER-3 / ATCC MYA-2586) TaxID=559297 RepID=A0ABP2F5V3_AJEDR|nr:carboxylase:pyruvate/acetyl-CoA/propionyl-CoA [Blastomyces dermatitidis ER-3]EEQ92456.1 carboxylase:pyruvate/acetyl-CoA/propionyl-CoA [Blastomyces dermatitidis ER-3]
MTPPPARPIKRLLVANRGEIAVRILQAARELSIETFALYTEDDRSHCDVGAPHHVLALPSPASYMDIALLVQLVRENSIDTIHPGYGFLSESAEFAQRIWEEAGAKVIGPGWEVLARTGDKLQAKELAEACGVPILKAMKTPTNDINLISRFAAEVGYPVMVKAVDGGGGRGIRFVKGPDELQSALDRATGESPSKKVFVEKAAVGGFHHVEVQIIGDGTGEVRHLWERDCSVQRRFQKIVECAPAMMKDRGLIRRVIEAALRIASEIKYLSLGTFEFLVSGELSEFYFLEINPRLQVEHTITECISSVDLVQTQLLLAQGVPLRDMGLGDRKNPEQPPTAYSIQLRLCAEDPGANFALSIGKITEFHVPGGNGVRVDTNISGSSPVVIGSDFDNMMAKIIVTSTSWDSVLRKARRVLDDTRISGVKSNIDVLKGILANHEFQQWQIDTQWLEKHLEEIIQYGKQLSSSRSNQSGLPPASSTPQTLSLGSSSVLFRKGDAWSVELTPLNSKRGSASQTPHHLLLSKLLRNEFPTSLSAEIEYTTPATATQAATTTPYRVTLSSTSASSISLSSTHRRGDLNNSSHITLPMSGKLTEMLVEEGDEIQENTVIAFVKQMKMELEVRSPRAGIVTWALELENEEGEDVPEGILLAEVTALHASAEQVVGVKGKL